MDHWTANKWQGSYKLRKERKEERVYINFFSLKGSFIYGK